MEGAHGKRADQLRDCGGPKLKKDAARNAGFSGTLVAFEGRDG
jgi:hypothetical protein